MSSIVSKTATDEASFSRTFEVGALSKQTLSSVATIGMNNYSKLGKVGEGSYGKVLKCRHKLTGNLVAIKKFPDSEDDKYIRRIAIREISILKLLQHDNLVTLLEMFHRRKCLYLVFEFMDYTILDEILKCPTGLDEDKGRQVMWQVLQGTQFCHSHNVIHRDLKPENILINKSGIVKICDFGFARTLTKPEEAYTDYVSTRWYRAPELIVGDTKYGRAVDVWAIGCLASELMSGEPLFPGESDIDQLYLIMKCFGSLTKRQREVYQRNPLFIGMKMPEVHADKTLEKMYPLFSVLLLSFLKECLQLDAKKRSTCKELLKHVWFFHDEFGTLFPLKLKEKLKYENRKDHHSFSEKSSECRAEAKNVNQFYENQCTVEKLKPLEQK